MNAPAWRCPKCSHVNHPSQESCGACSEPREVKPSTIRARRSLATRQANGGRVVRVILSPEAARALDTLTADGLTMTTAIELAILAAALDSLKVKQRLAVDEDANGR